MSKNNGAKTQENKGAHTDNLQENDGFVRVDNNFRKWDFEKDGTLTGYFTGKRHITPQDESKEQFDILTFVTDTGERVSTPANHQLVETLDKETDMCGMLYRIQKIGETKVDKGNLSLFDIRRKPATTKLDPSFIG